MPPDIRRVLVPIDFSTCSKRALEHALFFCERYLRASLDVFHVIGPSGHSSALEASIEDERGARLETVSSSPLAADMERLLREAEGRGLVIRRRFDSGDPVRRIVALAGSDGYDLIFMGTHGRTGLEHQYLGSVAELVVRFAPCPVFTVRASLEPTGAV